MQYWSLDDPFSWQKYYPNNEIAPLYVGKEITTFREMADRVDKAIRPATGKPYHTAIRYGVSQACLDAVAKSRGLQMAEVIAEEYGTTVSEKIIPIFSQSGDDRYLNADKMIMKGADVLPHALFNHVETKTGRNGEKIKEYLRWLHERILEMRPSSEYQPAIHIDVYGTLSTVFDDDIVAIADYMGELTEIVKPFKLRVEGPVDLGEKEAQIKALHDLRVEMEKKGIDAEIVADEWCNSLEDIKDFSLRKRGI